jgi:hypothetical protein
MPRCLVACGIFAVLLTACTGCTPTPSGGISVDPNDQTPASVGLQASEANPGAQTVSAGALGTTTNLAVRQRTAVMNLLATAKDSESGVQALQIWGDLTLTTCVGAICTQSHPLLGAPLFDTSEPKKGAGEQDEESTLMLEPLDLSGLIPANATSAQLDLWAEAFNHAGLDSKTGQVRVSWRAP